MGPDPMGLVSLEGEMPRGAQGGHHAWRRWRWECASPSQGAPGTSCSSRSLENGTRSSLESPKGAWPCQPLDCRLLGAPSAGQSVCCFKPSGFWCFVAAALGNEDTSTAQLFRPSSPESSSLPLRKTLRKNKEMEEEAEEEERCDLPNQLLLSVLLVSQSRTCCSGRQNGEAADTCACRDVNGVTGESVAAVLSWTLLTLAGSMRFAGHLSPVSPRLLVYRMKAVRAHSVS